MSSSIKDEAVQTLAGLGLNSSQARVYFALLQKGTSTAKQISKFSGVNRQEIYRIMPKLIKLGLATKIIDIPTKWKATPIRQGVSILLENKKKETSELHKKATKIINDIKGNNNRTKSQEEEQAFKIIPQKITIKNWIPRTIEKTYRNNDVITTMESHNRVMYAQGEAFIKAAKRGVNIRIIVYKGENEKISPKIAKFNDIANISTKFVTGVPLGVMAIHDNKIAIINTHPMGGGPSFVSSNLSLVRILSNHFELLWKTTT
jgi:sugar-specific transcriptional regulator TrmB